MSIVVRLRRAPARSMAVVVASLLGMSLACGCATAPESVAMRVPVITWDAPAAPGAVSSGASTGSEWADWNSATPGSGADAAPTTTAQQWGGRSGGSSAAGDRHVTLLVGERWVDEDDWEPLENQLAFGLEMDDFDPSDGNGYELGLLYAEDDDDASVFVPGFGVVDASVDVETFELYGGFRHTFRAGQEGLQPFVSAGLTALQTEVSADTSVGSASDDDATFGAYVRLGLLWEIGERARLGVDVRHVFADDYELAGVEVDADYDQVMVSLGWAF